MKPYNPEVIQAATPLFLITAGLVIGIATIFSPATAGDSAKWTAGLGLAGTAFAGAAGLAQTGKRESDFSVKKQGDNLQVQTPATQEGQKT